MDDHSRKESGTCSAIRDRCFFRAFLPRNSEWLTTRLAHIASLQQLCGIGQVKRGRYLPNVTREDSRLSGDMNPGYSRFQPNTLNTTPHWLCFDCLFYYCFYNEAVMGLYHQLLYKWFHCFWYLAEDQKALLQLTSLFVSTPPTHTHNVYVSCKTECIGILDFLLLFTGCKGREKRQATIATAEMCFMCTIGGQSPASVF